MRETPIGMARCALLACIVVLVGACPAQAYQKQSYRVPVSQPDELGQPVTLDTDVYLPDTPAPAGGYPLIQIYHGGGSEKSNPFDSGHAAFFADHGYASIIYSQRGHGNSDGQTAIAGPKEMRDLFDVTHWGLVHFPIDPTRIGLSGYSQGGLHTNLGQVWAGDPTYNPYGISFRVLEPGNTPDFVFGAIVPHDVVKLSFGAGILAQSYLLGTHGRIAPEVLKWTASTSVDEPQLYGGGLCDVSGHDSATSSLKTDWAFRSVGCFPDRLTPPVLWAQAFDDGLFPAEMAISMWRKLHPRHPSDRLYLSMGGHAAPAAPPAVEQDKLNEQLAYLNHFMRGTPLRAPPIVYWTRRPSVAVPASTYQWPNGSWYRQTARSWPPRGTTATTYRLSANGTAVRGAAQDGTLPLQPLSEDERNDSVAAAAMSSTPFGTSPVPSQLPATDLPGFVAAFQTPAFPSARELSGTPRADLDWTPASPDSQLVVELFDKAPDGTLTLLTRGVQGLRGAVPGMTQRVAVQVSDTSDLIAAGHRLVAWVMAGDLAYYKPYSDGAGGVLKAGRSSTLTLPLRDPAPCRGGSHRRRCAGRAAARR